MSDKPPPRRRSSGDHPAVKAFRDKLDSIEDEQLDKLRALNSRLRRMTNEEPPTKEDAPPTEPAPPPDSEEGTTVVEVPPAPRVPKDAEPPAPESKS